MYERNVTMPAGKVQLTLTAFAQATERLAILEEGIAHGQARAVVRTVHHDQGGSTCVLACVAAWAVADVTNQLPAEITLVLLNDPLPKHFIALPKTTIRLVYKAM